MANVYSVTKSYDSLVAYMYVYLCIYYFCAKDQLEWLAHQKKEFVVVKSHTVVYPIAADTRAHVHVYRAKPHIYARKLCKHINSGICRFENQTIHIHHAPMVVHKHDAFLTSAAMVTAGRTMHLALDAIKIVPHVPNHDL